MAEFESSFSASIREVENYSALRCGHPLIGLTGPAGSGKDSIAERLMIHGFIPTAFAEPLRNAASEAFGVDYGAFDEPEKMNPFWAMTPRQMLGRTRDALTSQFGAEFLARRWALTYTEFREVCPCVVSDVSTEIEAETIRDCGGTIIRVWRPGCIAADRVKFRDGDIVIGNEKGLKDLFRKVDQLLADLSHHSITKPRIGNVETAPILTA